MLSMIMWGTAKLHVKGLSRDGIDLPPGSLRTSWPRLISLSANIVGLLSPRELCNCIWAIASLEGSRRTRQQGGVNAMTRVHVGGGYGSAAESAGAVDVLLNRASALVGKFNEQVWMMWPSKCDNKRVIMQA